MTKTSRFVTITTRNQATPLQKQANHDKKRPNSNKSTTKTRVTHLFQDITLSRGILENIILRMQAATDMQKYMTIAKLCTN